MNLNQVTLIGRLAQDGKLSPSEKPNHDRLNFKVIVNRSYNQEEYDVIQCVVWGKLANSACKWLKKGKEVTVCGELQITTLKTETGFQTYPSIKVNKLEYGHDSKKSQQEFVTNEEYDDVTFKV
jgi:single-strand DNA-binding protein